MPVGITTSKPGIVWQGSFHSSDTVSVARRELALAVLACGHYDLSIEADDSAAGESATEGRFAPLKHREGRRLARPAVVISSVPPAGGAVPAGARRVVFQPAAPEAVAGGDGAEVWVLTEADRDRCAEWGADLGRLHVLAPDGVPTDWSSVAAAAIVRLRAVIDGKPDLSAQPAPPRVDPHTAGRLYDAGRYEECLQAADALLENAPTDSLATCLRARCLAETGRRAEAIAYLREGLDKANDPVALHATLSELLRREGDLAGAAAHALSAWRGGGETRHHELVETVRSEAVHQARKIRKTGSGKASRRPSPDERARMKSLLAVVSEIDEALKGAGPSVPGVKRPTISLVMIAKNEERFLRGCLESARPYVDEIVLVDTGSTDATKAIAAEFGARIFHFDWVEDFSAARNVSLQHATGDWALWLDADERLAEGQGELVQAVAQNAHPGIGACFVDIGNYLDGTRDGAVVWHRATRLFRRLPGVCFTGRIHEQVAESVEELGLRIAASPIKVEHYGYAEDVMTERNKHERFLRMLHREVEEGEGTRLYAFQLFNLGNTYFTQGRFDDACSWFEKSARNTEPDSEFNEMLYVLWAVGCCELERYQEVETVCAEAEAHGIRNPGLHYARGLAASRQGDHLSAVPYYLAALAAGKMAGSVPKGDAGVYGYKAHAGLAHSFVALQRYQEAVQEAELALADYPNMPDVRHVLAHALTKLGRKQEAMRHLERLIADAPERVGAQLDLGMLLHEAGEYERAIPLLRCATLANPTLLTPWLTLADCCEQTDRHAEACDAYRRARELKPDSAPLHVNLGRTLAALRKDAEAIDCFAEAMRLAPEEPNIYFNAGDLLYKLGYYPTAVEALCAGLSRDPANAQGFFVLGNCFFHTSDFAAARAAYEQALSLCPQHEEARHNRSLAEEQMQRQSSAA